MRSPDFRLANLQDEPDLRKLASLTMPGGWIDLSYQREPNFFDGCNDPNDEVMLGRAPDGRLATLAVRSHRSVYLNGQPTPVAYLSNLRVDPDQQGRYMLWRGYRLLNQLQQQRPVAEHIATIIQGNQLAQALLVEKRRPSWPSFHHDGQLHTIAIPVGKAYQTAQLDLQPQPQAVEDFLDRHGPERHFFPQQRTQRHWEKRYWLAHDAGVMALRDLSACHQTVVQGYRRPLNWLRPLYNLFAKITGRPQLPKVGDSLRGVYAGFVCTRSPAAFKLLLDGALELARRLEKDWLYVGIMDSDPNLATALSYSKHVYRSDLYRVFFTARGNAPGPENRNEVLNIAECSSASETSSLGNMRIVKPVGAEQSQPDLETPPAVSGTRRNAKPAGAELSQPELETPSGTYPALSGKGIELDERPRYLELASL